MEINSFFDVLRNLTSEKDHGAVGTKHFSAYMANRFLSMDERYLSLAVASNRLLAGTPARANELFFFHAVPKSRVYLKYVKGKRPGGANIDSVVEETGVSDKKAHEISEFMSRLAMAENGVNG
jgi:hypothetical protein